MFKRISSWRITCYTSTQTSSHETPEEDESNMLKRRITIGTPYCISHDLHVTYNFKHARFEGIDQVEWMKQVNQHFGVPFNHLPRLYVDGYEDRIPAVLIMLKEKFHASNGSFVPHIFRESPNKEDRDLAIQQINKGIFDGCNDVRILADLIKVWFRDLPKPLLHEIDHETMDKIVKKGCDSVPNVLKHAMNTLERSILYWLADLLVEVSEFQWKNHMGLSQMAIIVAPNLFRIDTTNPLVAVIYSKTIVEFFKCVLKYRASCMDPKQSIIKESIKSQNQQD